MDQRYRSNLLKLAAHLEKKPSLYRRLLRVKFSMRHYAKNVKLYAYRELMPDELLEARRCPRHYCGTVVCALGEAALLFPKEVKDLTFAGVARQLFGIGSFSDAWYWLFDAEWAMIDDTREGAAARIRWYLEHGVPRNWCEQMRGIEPLCYVITD